MEVEQFRVLIKHCSLMGKTVMETIRWLQKCYTGCAPSISTVRRWVTRLKNGDLSLREEPRRTGGPKFAVTQENVKNVLKIVRANRKIKISEIADLIRIFYGSVFTILNEHLNMKKNFARWVPRFLTPDQKQQRVDGSKRCLEIFRRDKINFFLKICDDERNLDTPLYSGLQNSVSGMDSTRGKLG